MKYKRVQVGIDPKVIRLSKDYWNKYLRKNTEYESRLKRKRPIWKYRRRRRNKWQVTEYNNNSLCQIQIINSLYLDGVSSFYSGSRPDYTVFTHINTTDTRTMKKLSDNVTLRIVSYFLSLFKKNCPVQNDSAKDGNLNEQDWKITAEMEWENNQLI